MKIFLIESYIKFGNGIMFKVRVSYSEDNDLLEITFHERITRREETGRGSLVSWPEYEDVSLITVDSLPGCIMNTVQLLKNSAGEICGLQLLPISRFPELPRGSESLYSYLHLLEDTAGFEATGGLRDAIGMGEDFLKAIRLGVTIPKYEPATAA